MQGSVKIISYKITFELHSIPLKAKKIFSYRLNNENNTLTRGKKVLHSILMDEWNTTENYDSWEAQEITIVR